MHIAAGLISTGENVVYATSSSWARDALIQRACRLPLLSKSWLARNLRRRELPGGIGRRHVLHAALGYEVLFQLAMTFGSHKRTAALRRRVAKFESKMARYIRTHEVRGVFCQYMGAEKIFAATGRQTPKLLGYPIAHHRWMEKHLGEEALSNPDWAEFLQGHNYDEAFLKKLDSEVEMSDRILVPSNFVRSTFIENGVPEEKIFVVPLAATIVEDAGKTKAYSVNAATIADPLKVLFAGQVTQRKGISYVLEAIAAVPESELIIVGSPMPGIIERIGKFPRVNMHASQPRDLLVRTMGNADVLVLPSLAEGFPLVVIEAMSCGTPCIISRSTFAEDVIEDRVNGILVDSQRSDQIVDALRHFIERPSEIARMGIAARATSEQFTWARYELATTAAVRDALANH